MFKTILAWLYFWGVFFRYPLYKLGLIERPMWINRSDLSQLAWGQMIGWNPRIRVVHPERCPQAHPVVFVANHIKLDDPFYVWRAVHRATQERLDIRFMMRDDYFRGFPWTLLPVDLNNLSEMGGAVLISRDNIQLSQLRPLLRILETPGSFVLFPGRTRSRGGMVFEYREGVDEPGAASFFMNQIQRKHPALRVAAAPVARTHHPVWKKSALVFGDVRYLESGASKEAQRAVDYALTEDIGGLVELHGPHIIAGIIYLDALHGISEGRSSAQYVAAVKRIVGRLKHPYLHPLLQEHPEREVEATLRFFARGGMLRMDRGLWQVTREAVLNDPPLDTRYRKANPVKFSLNQVLHLTDVIRAIEAEP